MAPENQELRTKNFLMPTRNGKIARLPLAIRETLNAFLSEGHTAEQILKWLNDEPEVIAILKSQFEGRLVSPQNLSEWRQGGYEEWRTTRDCLDDARAFAETEQSIAHSGVRAEHLLTVLTARWAGLITRWDTMDPTAFIHAKHNLADLTKNAISIRRIELQTARLQMERERLDLLGEKKSAASSPSPEQSTASQSSSPESESSFGLCDENQEPGTRDQEPLIAPDSTVVEPSSIPSSGAPHPETRPLSPTLRELQPAPAPEPAPATIIDDARIPEPGSLCHSMKNREPQPAPASQAFGNPKPSTREVRFDPV